MTVITSRAPEFNPTEKDYENFNRYYDMAVGAHQKGERISGALRLVMRMRFSDMLRAPIEVRERFPNLNERLAQLIDLGLLRPNNSQIKPYDPATERFYWKNLYKG